MASRYEEQLNPQHLLQLEPTLGFQSAPATYEDEQRELREFVQRVRTFPPYSSGVQQFGSGATRSSDEGKNEYEGFIHPGVLELFGNYMTKHRVQPDGSVREPDNWQRGIPVASYKKSFVRHALELWMLFRGHVPARVAREMPGASHREMVLETACAILFNIMGFLFEEFVRVKKAA